MRRIRAVVREILEKSNDAHHVYLDKKKTGKAAFLVIASDKGLCGAYNYNICECAERETRKYENPHIESAGISGTEILIGRGMHIEREWLSASQQPSIYSARLIGETLINLYNNNEINEIFIIYTHYYNQAVQKAVCQKILPLDLNDFYDVSDEYVYRSDIIYEPTKQDVFNTLVPQYIIGYIYGCLNQAMISENIARMNAMQSSTRNADEMIKKLHFEFNTARQLAITNEITEIAAATEITNKSE
jgi:F-type H+-transporting ATPase subunit gamma